MTNEHPDAAESMPMAELDFGDGSRTEETESGLAVLREFHAFRDGGHPFPSYSDEELEERWAHVASVTEDPNGAEPAGADEPLESDSRNVPDDAESGADSAENEQSRTTADGWEHEGALASAVKEVWFVPRDDTGWQQHRETWHERFELDLMAADGSSAAVLEARAPTAGNTAHHWYLQLKCTVAVDMTDAAWRNWSAPLSYDETTRNRGWLARLKRALDRVTRAPEREFLFVVLLPRFRATALDRPVLAWSTPPPLGDSTGVEGGIPLPVPAAVLCVAQQEEPKWHTGGADAAFLALPERLFPVRDHLPDLRAYWHSTLHQRLPEKRTLPRRE